MNILEKACLILQKPVCDHCLGRQFGQLLSGTNNEERGTLLRNAAAMSIDKEKLNEEDKRLDLSNFSGIRFHYLKEKMQQKPCSVCSGIFNEIEKYAGKIAEKTKGIDFSTFLIGTKLSAQLLENEEQLWERIGIDWAEQLKAELNREIGRTIEKALRKKFNPKNPDIAFLVDISKGAVSISINPLFIYGEYQKLARGIPQTKWPSGKYKTSVEQIIAKPFMRRTRGKAHSFHGMGREDIDARCLAWRPFVLEIKEPQIRHMDLKKTEKEVKKDRRVKVRKMRCSDMNEVRMIKETRADKTYLAIIECRKKIDKLLIRKLPSLKTEIRQRTPERVLHRRANLLRRRNVKMITARLLSAKKMQLKVKTDAGLYVKELVSGDGGRTKPSLSELLQNECVCKELDVIKIEIPKRKK
ncbi:MAG: tRNA pseudouridine(54/55) synthase Pus10 [Candidatus Aenigmarchaeota archaeon]|nr:tRNA pseudouridine(54/55) synthase Pus10 [Candidatus Aenigmarchaeota archaeon]